MMLKSNFKNDGSLLALIKENMTDGRGDPCNEWENGFNLKKNLNIKLKKHFKPP